MRFGGLGLGLWGGRRGLLARLLAAKVLWSWPDNDDYLAAWPDGDELLTEWSED